jgi:DUF1680 family protein
MRTLAAALPLALVPALLMAQPPTPPAAGVTVVNHPPTAGKNSFYPGNKAPLRTTPLVPLPTAAFQPAGWLAVQLRLMKDGYVGQLPRISRFLQKDKNAWLQPEATDATGWEEVPYWLRGYIDLAYLLDDDGMIREAHGWIEAAIKSQAPDGYFGPARNRASKGDAGNPVGKPDLWANMVMTDCLISYFDRTGDKRVLDLLTRFYAWAAKLPDSDFLSPYWQQVRGGDMLAQVYWLYNRTGDPALLEFAHRTHKHTLDWSLGVPDDHVVNVAEAFRGPATYWLLSGQERHLRQSERGYAAMMEQYGQFPGGGIAADERWRPGYDDPRNMFETCGMVEMMHSHQMMTRFTGDPVWADRCEEVAFNSLPASATSDLKALRYLTAANMVFSDRKDRRPELFNGGPMTLMNPYGHRCCQHNSAFGWPYFAKNAWYATNDDGLAAVLYAPLSVTAKVAGGATAAVEVRTKYPFEDVVELVVTTDKPATFPLYLRVPGWCPKVTLSGSSTKEEFAGAGGKFLRVTREWPKEAKLTVAFDAPVRVKTWTAQKNNVSVHRGPLAFSVYIPEKVSVADDLPPKPGYAAPSGERLPDFPIVEIKPGGPWNYGLAVDPARAAGAFTVVRKGWPADGNPFASAAAPIELTVPGKKIPGWVLNDLDMPGRVQRSPARSSEPTETVRLVPMGSARLRITVMPLVSDGPEAAEWARPKESGGVKVTASFCHPDDTPRAVIDGVPQKSSDDQYPPRMTWWDHKGSSEWVQQEFPAPRPVRAVKVYWYDDTPRGGGCKVPASWRVVYRDGKEWKPVKAAGTYGVEKDKFNTVAFDPVTTDALRLEVQLQPGASGGVLEWVVE